MAKNHKCNLGVCFKVVKGKLVNTCCTSPASIVKQALGYAPKAPYTLASGEALHRKNPRTFEIPDPVTRTSLNKGDLAKLIFKKGKDGERMWVKITKRSGTGAKAQYEGKLDNSPSLLKNLKRGAAVAFGPRHVIDAVVKGHGYTPLSKGQQECASTFIGQEMRTDKYPRKQAVAIGMSRARREC